MFGHVDMGLDIDNALSANNDHTTHRYEHHVNPPSLLSSNHTPTAGREKRKGPMISAGDAEFPRDYHTLAAGGGRGARRFPDNSNGGFTSSSLDRRHNSVAAKSLEALNSIHKADIERQRDALMDLQKNKYSNCPGGMSQGTATGGRQVRSLCHV